MSTPDDYCGRHNTRGAGACPYCLVDQGADVVPEGRIRELREQLRILEARIADGESAQIALGMRVADLEHDRIAAQKAHNALAGAHEHLAELFTIQTQTYESLSRQIAMLIQQDARRGLDLAKVERAQNDLDERLTELEDRRDERL